MEDKYLRMAAEYDNFRRRSREEKDALYEMAMADTVKELLPIIDNLDRAAGFTEGDKIIEGLKLISKTTSSVFEKLGVEEYGKVGDTFDPNVHNAIMHTDDETFPENTITQVFQQGFKIGEKIVRFAMEEHHRDGAFFHSLPGAGFLQIKVTEQPGTQLHERIQKLGRQEILPRVCLLVLALYLVL